MSSNNGKGKGKTKAAKQKPVEISVVAAASIMQLYNKKTDADSRLNLALTLLKQQLGVPDGWDYLTEIKAFVPPGAKVAQLIKAASKTPPVPPPGDRGAAEPG
jgi:hypothetical protein